MGLFRILGGALIGITLAPFTGGTALLATAIASGAAAHYIGEADDEDDQNKARAQGRKEGHRDGYRQGQVDAASKFAKLLEQSDSMKEGAFAIGVYVAKLDGDFSDEEADAITDALGHPESSIVEPHVRSEYQEILETSPDFERIKNKYLNCLSVEQLSALDTFVREIMEADGIIADKEEVFYNKKWKPYLDSRK